MCNFVSVGSQKAKKIYRMIFLRFFRTHTHVKEEHKNQSPSEHDCHSHWLCKLKITRPLKLEINVKLEFSILLSPDKSVGEK